MFKKLVTILSILFVIGLVYAGNQYIGQKQEYITSYSDFTGNELTSAKWVTNNFIHSGDVKPLTGGEAINVTGGKINLGGIATNDVNIDMDGNEFDIISDMSHAQFMSDSIYMYVNNDSIEIGAGVGLESDQTITTSYRNGATVKGLQVGNKIIYNTNTTNDSGFIYNFQNGYNYGTWSIPHLGYITGLIDDAKSRSGNLIVVNNDNTIDLSGYAIKPIDLHMEENPFTIQDIGGFHIYTNDDASIDMGVDIKLSASNQNDAGSGYVLWDHNIGGFSYSRDYSGNNSSNDRWLVDKGYVNTAISDAGLHNGNAITIDSNHKINLGGDMTQDATISQNFHGITFDDGDFKVTNGINVNFEGIAVKIKGDTNSNWNFVANGQDTSIDADDDVTIGASTENINIGNDDVNMIINSNNIDIAGGSSTINMTGDELKINSSDIYIGKFGTTIEMDSDHIEINAEEWMSVGVGDCKIGFTDAPSSRGSYFSAYHGTGYIGYYNGLVTPDTYELKIGAKKHIGMTGENITVYGSTIAVTGANNLNLSSSTINMTGDVVFRGKLKLIQNESGAVWQTLSGSTRVDFKTREF